MNEPLSEGYLKLLSGMTYGQPKQTAKGLGDLWIEALKDPIWWVGVVHGGIARYESQLVTNARLRAVDRATAFGPNWDQGSLMAARNRFAPGVEGVKVGPTKTYYTNSSTGISVIYDRHGNYFRIIDPSIQGKLPYLDMNGGNANNRTVNGKVMGNNQAEYNKATHFKNTD
jgi:hypothetical protein